MVTDSSAIARFEFSSVITNGGKAVEGEDVGVGAGLAVGVRVALDSACRFPLATIVGAKATIMATVTYLIFTADSFLWFVSVTCLVTLWPPWTKTTSSLRSPNTYASTLRMERLPSHPPNSTNN